MRKRNFNNTLKDNTKGTLVEVRNGNVEKAIRTLKKKLIGQNLFQELRERQFFESKGTKRRKAKEKATRRYQMKLMKRKKELGY